MLKNILEKVVEKNVVVFTGIKTIQYNKIPIEVKPGQNLDVRDFGIPNESIEAVERHILFKNPNVFSQSKTRDVHETNKAALKKIDELEAELSGTKKELEAYKKAAKDASDKLNKVQAENEGLTKNNKSLQESVKDLEAKLKAVK